MKRLFILAFAAMSVALLFAASRASAADLPVRPGPPAYYPVAAVYDWGGGYIGVNGGYAFGQSQWSDALNRSGNNASDNFNVNGGLAGVTAGVSGQWSAFVLSVEGDFDWQGLKGSSSNTFCTSIFTSPTAGSAPAGLGCKTQSNWLGTLRVRTGWAWDRVLLYGTVGVAGANVQTGLTGLPPQTNFQVGWTAGAGLEWAFADNWTAKVEYLFVDLGKAACNHGYSCGYDAPAVTVPPVMAAVNGNDAVKLNESLIRVGVNFKFGH
jgi:outer membrane immunogenic protein